jgi:hypothetical protein
MDWAMYLPPLVGFAVALVSLFFRTSIERKGQTRKTLTRPGWFFILLLVATLATGVYLVSVTLQSKRNASERARKAERDRKEALARLSEVEDHLQTAG